MRFGAGSSRAGLWLGRCAVGQRSAVGCGLLEQSLDASLARLALRKGIVLLLVPRMYFAVFSWKVENCLARAVDGKKVREAGILPESSTGEGDAVVSS
jgi:hypothetical protein